MNRHFTDAKYHISRTAENVKLGIKHTAENVESAFRRAVGREKEPEPSRIDLLKEEVRDLEQRAEGEAKDAYQTVQSKIESIRHER